MLDTAENNTIYASTIEKKLPEIPPSINLPLFIPQRYSRSLKHEQQAPEDSNSKIRRLNKLTLASIILSRVVAQPPSLIVGLLLIEIAQTYQIPLAIVGQLQVASSTMLVLTGLAMSYLATRYSYKSLMLLGLTIYSISFLGNSIAPSFHLLILTYSLYGVARGTVDPMASSIIGKLLPPERRSNIIGWFYAGMALLVLVGTPLINLLQDAGGWRATFTFFALPLSLIAMIMAYILVPKTENASASAPNTKNLIEGYRRILGNRSASACIIAALLSESSWSAMLLFSFTFLRQRYSLSPSEVSPVLVGTSVLFILGSLSGGRLVARFGRRRLAIASCLLLGFLVLAFMNTSAYMVSNAVFWLACFFSSMRYTVGESLTLEQVPDLRGSVMSLNSVASGLGSTIGASLGGFLLSAFDYTGLGFIGLLALSASGLYLIFTHE